MDMKHGGNVWEGDQPETWLDFSANLRPEGTPCWVLEVMERALADTRYYPDRALSAARHGLARYLGVEEACVLPTAGGAAAIDLMTASAGKRVRVLPVTFGEYRERAEVHGKPVSIWDGEGAPGDMVIFCNPNNPTGEVRSREELRALSQRLLACGGDLVVDEAFIDFCPENSVRRDVHRGLTVVGSLTKTLCIPGVRLGYICGEPERIAALQRQALPWALGTLASAVAAALPEHREEIKQDLARNLPRREAFQKELRALGADVREGHANFLLADFGRDMTGAAQCLKERKILVRTCASFGLPGSFLRLAVKREEENARLVRELRDILEEESCAAKC